MFQGRRSVWRVTTTTWRKPNFHRSSAQNTSPANTQTQQTTRTERAFCSLRSKYTMLVHFYGVCAWSDWTPYAHLPITEGKSWNWWPIFWIILFFVFKNKIELENGLKWPNSEDFMELRVRQSAGWNSPARDGKRYRMIPVRPYASSFVPVRDKRPSHSYL